MKFGNGGGFKSLRSGDVDFPVRNISGEFESLDR